MKNMLKRIGLVLLGAIIMLGWSMYYFKPKCFVYYVTAPTTAYNQGNFNEPLLSKLVINKQLEASITWQY